MAVAPDIDFLADPRLFVSWSKATAWGTGISPIPVSGPRCPSCRSKAGSGRVALGLSRYSGSGS